MILLGQVGYSSELGGVFMVYLLHLEFRIL
jgi:hypothetical protein